MKNEYDFNNAIKNPHINKTEKQQITIKLDNEIIVYFKKLAEDTGIPYQTLINMYLSDCVKNEKKLKFV